MELIPVWNGALEARGDAPGLSNYAGRSSLHHSASWAQGEGLADGERAKPEASMWGSGRSYQFADKPRPAYVPRKITPRLSPERAQAVAVLLRKGVSYRTLARDWGVTFGQARRVAKEIGMSRGHFSGRPCSTGAA